ncbi:MAG: AAA family ATPase [Thermoleophilaceae bacterium]|nr:AAA family ATPase [Thermoleophilaceae bacterium]
MADHPAQEPIAAALADPAFYPDPPATVEVRETHISWVFLAGERAFKLRKAVVFPFLDYGTPQRRRAMAEEEIRLGRRLAPDLYRGLHAVVETPDGYSLGSPGAPGAVEHVVEMARFDEERTLAALLAAGGATEDVVRALGRRLARFHAEAEPAPGSFGPSEAAAEVIGNFTTLLEEAETVGPLRLAAAHRFALSYLSGRRGLLAARAGAGLVRDCHGDLRLEHVLVEDGGVSVFDPVEFDPALRRIDVAADIAFLVMELSEAGRDDLGAALVDEYTRAGGDAGGDELLSFYAAYRAWVRAKVACLRAAELPGGPGRARRLEHARALGALGERLAWRARRPLVIVVCGAAATGKTSLAEALSDQSGLTHLNSDLVRKELLGVPASERAPASAYGEAASLRTYEEIGVRARRAPGGAIVDATFRLRAHRDAFARGYGPGAPAPVFAECRAPAEVVAERAEARELEPERVSDATAAIAGRQAREFEPLDEVSPARHVLLRADRELAAVADDLLAALDARLAREAGR